MPIRIEQARNIIERKTIPVSLGEMLARTGDGMKEEELICAICLNEFTDEEQIETIVRGECMVIFFMRKFEGGKSGTNSGQLNSPN